MNFTGENDLSKKIKDFAFSLGFDLIGIAPVKELSEQKRFLSNWLDSGMNADLGFISRDIEKRADPALLFEGARSVIVAAMNYFTKDRQGNNGIPVISRYAYGKDYHYVLGEKLKELLNYIASLNPVAKGKVCVDSSPVMEKAWAKEAGLGWIGKNSILINREIGSFIFLGEIILNIDIKYDRSIEVDHCGNCNLCVEACPTKAINTDRTIDARKCISWLTVENRKEIPTELKIHFNNIIFGCDICQDVCPWNKNAKPHNIPEFKISDRLKKMSLTEWTSLTEEEFDEIFKNSPIKRATYRRFIDNINSINPTPGKS